jgi:hypothetical protein
MWHVWGRGEVPTGFWLEDLTDSDYLEDPGIDGRTIFKMVLQEVGWGPRIGTVGGLL